jgi:dipeptidyl aminopeptidase/acylaminoacyl peptidase
VLLEGPTAGLPLEWSRDGRFLLYRSVVDPVTGADLWVVPMVGERKPFPIARTPANETLGSFSPDGRWIAIESDETGRSEIYVQRFPSAAARALVSTAGGPQPQWRPDGRELFYVAPDGKLMAVALRFDQRSERVEPAPAVPLLATRLNSVHTGGSRQEYVVAPDGRFLMNTLVEETGTPITLVLRRPR